MTKAPAARHRARPRLDGAVLRLGDREIPLLSGALHYWRLPPEHWRDALRQLKALGLPIVETYAPWGVHEVPRTGGEGVDFDFGAKDPRKDLGAFLDLAAEEELLVFLRPGPHINAELTGFGLPSRVLEDPEVQARSPRGNPVVLYFPPRMFAVPSHASEAYREQAGEWYEALAAIVAPRLYPEGPVVLLQVDNELGFFFRSGPYCQDYHDDAVALWHSFLDERHGGLEGVAAAHRRTYGSWAEASPPSSFDASLEGDARAGELVRQTDWAAFAEHLHSGFLRHLRARLGRAGLGGVPTTHNVSIGEGGAPISVPGLAAEVDLVGLDYYHAAREHRAIKRRTLYMAGTVSAPWAPELGVGAPAWFTPLSHHDSLTTAMTACAYGLRGFNLYMAVDRDRWFGAPIDATGRPRAEATDWRRLIAALQETGFHSLQRRVRVALEWPREYQRLTRATHLLGAVSPAILEAAGGSPIDLCRGDALGFEQPIQLAWWEDLARVAEALTAANIPYVYVDSEAPDARFEGYDVIFSPSYELASPRRFERLARLAAAGVHVVFGPRLPHLDETLRPHAHPAPGGAAPTTVRDAMAHALVADWIDRRSLARPYATMPPVETCVHATPDGEDRVLFVMNPGAAREAEIALPRPTVARDVIRGESLSGESTLRVPLDDGACRMFVLEVERRKAPRARRGRS
ncbi:MAG: beta-galactosidase [Myxococcales bacterium]|nr:beta-galactosidase [Myxococcales bacterium]